MQNVLSTTRPGNVTLERLELIPVTLELVRTTAPADAVLCFVRRTKQDRQGRTVVRYYCNYIGYGSPAVSTPLFSSFEAVMNHVRCDWGCEI